MKKYILLLILLYSCSNKVVYYKAKRWAVEMAFPNSEYNVKSLSRKDLEKLFPIVYSGDTLPIITDYPIKKGDTLLFTMNKNTFGFKNMNNKEVYIIHFLTKSVLKTITLDSLWNVIEYHGNSGEDY